MAHEEIKALPSDALAQVEIRLARGESCMSVAEELQKAGHFSGLKPTTLKKRLDRYRTDCVDVPIAARERSIARAKNPQYQKALLKAADNFDTRATWIELIQQQKKRVFKWFEVGAGNMPSSAVREDIKLLGQMLKDFSAFQLETGEIRRAPRDVRALIGTVDEISPEFSRLELEMEQTAEKRKVIERVFELLRNPVDEIPALPFIEAGSEN